MIIEFQLKKFQRNFFYCTKSSLVHGLSKRPECVLQQFPLHQFPFLKNDMTQMNPFSVHFRNLFHNADTVRTQMSAGS